MATNLIVQLSQTKLYPRMQLSWLDHQSPVVFPPTELALDEPDGLLAAGGNLNVETLLSAYQQGIFPWFSEGEPPLWWAPRDRAVLYPDMVHISRSTAKILRKHQFRATTNQCFEQVIQHCSESRAPETWILPEMIEAYTRLHLAGHAKSLEIWQEDRLVGGLYGVQVGAIFCGESMFNTVSNAAKIAFTVLAKTLFSEGFEMIDCQMPNPFLQTLGVGEIDREDYEKELLLLGNKKIDWPVEWKVT